MGKTSGKSKLRRTQIRRQRLESAEPLSKRWREKVGVSRPAIALGFFVLAAAIVLYGQEPFPYYAGQEMLEPVYARVRFTIQDRQRTDQRRLQARQQTPNYYVLNATLVERIASSIHDLPSIALAYESYESYQAAQQEAPEADRGIPRWQLSAQAFAELRALQDEESKQRFRDTVDRLIHDLKRERLVLSGSESTRKVASMSNVAILKGAVPNANDRVLEGSDDVEVVKDTLEHYTEDNLRDVHRAASTLAGQVPPTLREIINLILLDAFKRQPLFRFDLERTSKQMEVAAGSQEEAKDVIYPTAIIAGPPLQITESTAGDFAAGPAEELALYNTRYRLAPDDYRRLQLEHDKYMALLTRPLKDFGKDEPEDFKTASELRRQHQIKQLALGGMVLLITLGMVTYCGMFQVRVVRNRIRALSIAVLFLVMLLSARAAVLTGWTVKYPYIVIAPIVMTAAIVTMVYSQRFAIGMTAALALLVTLAARGDLGMLLVMVACMAVAVYQLREIRSRNELFSTGLLNAVTALIVGMLAWLLKGHSLESALPQAGVAAGAALVAIALFFLILQPIERIFRVATNWTLFELLDTSKPLLARLAREAPGTFAHSLWLSSMAEGACEVIGANALLAKVGAMYHDIGKVHKAEYFSENQEANINRHDKLAPTMSLLVIIGHVKDGVELAKAEGLPPAVIHFIEEHHGTTLVRYFHHVASERQKAAGDTRGVSDTEFRYPGPKPQSKETAVLMLCDGVEGAVRALHEPTAGRIETVVHNVLMDRLNDGQFDECDITLKELHAVEQSLVKSLCRFYHGRVAYPKAGDSEQSSRTEKQEAAV